MDTRSFYGRKRNVTYRLAGEQGESDEEIAIDCDSEYLPEVQPLAEEIDSAKEGNCPGENDMSGLYITYFFPLH